MIYSDDENPYLMNEHARRNVVSTLFVLVVTGVCETKLFVISRHLDGDLLEARPG
jgi:hypothetical protein